MTNGWMSLFLAITLGVGVAACNGGGGGGTGGSGGGGDGGTGGTGEPAHVDLFACGVPLDCEQITRHLSEEPYSALECAAKRIIAGQPTVLSALDNPGPYLYETERLIVLFGDGTALVQQRHRECIPDACQGGIVDWEAPSGHQICNVILDDKIKSACEEGTVNQCAWSPWSLEGCVDVEDHTCADVAAALE